jgi:hypothetical protein
MASPERHPVDLVEKIRASLGSKYGADGGQIAVPNHKCGDSFDFYAGDIRVDGPHPLCSSGGNLGNGRTRTAMYTDSIEQLRGTAGAPQVRLRAETAPGAFTTPSSSGWIMFGKSPS